MLSGDLILYSNASGDFLFRVGVTVLDAGSVAFFAVLSVIDPPMALFQFNNSLPGRNLRNCFSFSNVLNRDLEQQWTMLRARAEN